MFRSLRPSTRAGAVLVGAALLLTGCSTAASTDASTDTTPSSASTPAATDQATGDQATGDQAAGAAVTLTDAWVKAADEGMSAAFGVLENTASADAVIVSAATDAAARLELHETAPDSAGQMVMREVEGGFTIPAGGSLTLEPGGDHLMLIDLAGPLRAGDEITFTLTFADGSEAAFTAPVKDFAGANETYEHGGGH
ncbi:copper chaperone PCu(A)C [Microbacterium sp. No. 7]|uniref:copper chaperone PCu(A)C n=1 Tax=Microbacterium sp. No. 7 TaxID=1714373 RepID=UPI0006D04538|nr:copper chaperone PCu(A)C [Microbacterium sp. No. 7]ALJ19832.1 hypothetical protein AOA12_07895 [Microbacterium sp. No. 7]